MSEHVGRGEPGRSGSEESGNEALATRAATGTIGRDDPFEEILEETIAEVPRRRLLVPIVVRLVLAIAVVWAVFFGVLPRVADMQRVFELIGGISVGELTVLLALAVLSLASRPFGLMASTPGRLGYWHGLTANQTSTAICNIVPGGGAFALVVNHDQYRSWGAGTQAFSLMLVVSGIWNNFIKLGMPVVAVGILATTGEVRAGLLVAAGIGMLILVASAVLFERMLRSSALTERVGDFVGRVVSRVHRFVRRPPVEGAGAAAVQARARGLGLVRKRWRSLTISLLAPNVVDFFVLLVALRALDVTAGQVGWQDVLVAYSVAKLLTVIPITPGGLGILELGLVGILVAAGGPEEQVVAATLLFRGLTFLPSFPVGAALGAQWWWWKRRRLATAGAS